MIDVKDVIRDLACGDEFTIAGAKYAQKFRLVTLRVKGGRASGLISFAGDVVSVGAPRPQPRTARKAKAHE